MSEVKEMVLQKKVTLARRVSDMFKDGANSGPPSLFRHASMQKIRHCCQNLNLFPYLLYSYDSSKSHPIAIKVNIYINFLKVVAHHVFFFYIKLHFSILGGLSVDSHKQDQINVEKKDKKEETNETKPKVYKTKKQKTPLFLVLAIYFAPLVLLFQVIGLLSYLINFGKYTPGFIFLVTALLCLGCISTKILFHNSIRLKKDRKKIQ